MRAGRDAATIPRALAIAKHDAAALTHCGVARSLGEFTRETASCYAPRHPMKAPRNHCALSSATTIVLALSALPSCKKPQTPTTDPVSSRSADASASVTVEPDASASSADAGPTAVDAGLGATTDASAPSVVLTIRIVNAASRPVPIFTNPDINEMIHTRRLRSRRSQGDGGRDSDPVKFFSVGQMPLCAEDGGAGYGGLGQPERREVAPGDAMEFTWDGLERREILDRTRGVCLEIGPPNPGRYRFELDQPHRTLRCNDVEFSWPLRDDAPRVLEMRCRIRTSSDDHGSSGDEG
jgi:hypothetical protein